MAQNGKARRVAVTGTGVVSPLGTGAAKFWAAIKRGECGVGPIEGIDLQDLYIRIGGEVRDFDPRTQCKSKALFLADRYSQYAGAAADEAFQQSGLDIAPQEWRARGLDRRLRRRRPRHDGKSLRGHLSSTRRRRRIRSRCCAPSAARPAAHVSIDHGIKGPVFGTVSACSTAAHAIGLAFQMIRSGAVDIAVAGAGEAAITYGAMRAWQAMRVLSPEGCFPFSKRRNGTVLGEGAGILVLEDLEHARARGATVLAELCGFGMTSDASDMVNPDVDGPTRAMQIALDDARLSPGDIGYLNAHGTATTANDINETRAIKKVFGPHAGRLPISSTKSMHGHCLGAGGGVEAVVCIHGAAGRLHPGDHRLRRAGA